MNEAEIGARYAALVRRKRALLAELEDVDRLFTNLWQSIVEAPPAMAGTDLPARDVGMNSVRLSDVATEVINRESWR